MKHEVAFDCVMLGTARFDIPAPNPGYTLKLTSGRGRNSGQPDGDCEPGTQHPYDDAKIAFLTRTSIPLERCQFQPRQHSRPRPRRRCGGRSHWHLCEIGRASCRERVSSARVAVAAETKKAAAER